MRQTEVPGRRALFLDRDGVINQDFGYVHTPDRTEWVDGVFDLCSRAQALGMAIVVVTNQAGIARGYYTENDFLAYTAWMIEQFRARGVQILAVYHCPHHPEMGKGALKTVCDCRKPAPGMILRAAREHALDLPHSALIGDKVSDIRAADAAGVGLRILVGQDGFGDSGIPRAARVETLAEAAWKLEEWHQNELR